MGANQTLDALETLMAMENLPNLSNIFVAGWYSGIGEFCKVLDSLHRLESHITERDSTLRYHAFAENAPPEPFPGYAVARFESRLTKAHAEKWWGAQVTCLHFGCFLVASQILRKKYSSSLMP